MTRHNRVRATARSRSRSWRQEPSFHRDLAAGTVQQLRRLLCVQFSINHVIQDHESFLLVIVQCDVSAHSATGDIFTGQLRRDSFTEPRHPHAIFLTEKHNGRKIRQLYFQDNLVSGKPRGHGWNVPADVKATGKWSLWVPKAGNSERRIRVGDRPLILKTNDSRRIPKNL